MSPRNIKHKRTIKWFSGRPEETKTCWARERNIQVPILNLHSKLSIKSRHCIKKIFQSHREVDLSDCMKRILLRVDVKQVVRFYDNGVAERSERKYMQHFTTNMAQLRYPFHLRVPATHPHSQIKKLKITTKNLPTCRALVSSKRPENSIEPSWEQKDWRTQ